MHTLMVERTIEDANAPAQSSSPFNTMFIVLFALFISYLALTISRRNKRK